ncbi:S8 family serine peptidase, partial [Streptomyces synnematoformans]|uniref:S8 family serine peptidase n=1 Tax=Streptomyces synnematoformans TaxID=415721 RepID=UPI0031D7B8DE
TVAHSADPHFGPRLRAVRGVQSAGATRTAPLPRTAAAVGEGAFRTYRDPGETGRQPRSDTAGGVPQEPMEADQWSLRVVRADRAHEISTGSPDVTVGVLDNGVEDTHPDLAANFSASRSADCSGGVADTRPGAWRPYPGDGIEGHGTWVSGQIAATAQASGVAALLASAHPRASAAELRRMLLAQADDPGCPDGYDPDGDGVDNAVCAGGDRYNGFYGAGVVDALDAVRR